METLAILLCLSSWMSLTEQKPSYLITAPKIIRVGVKESVTVQVFKAKNSLEASIHFFNKKTTKMCSEKYSLQLNKANNFTQVLFVQVTRENAEKCTSVGRMLYVSLVAEIPALLPSQRNVHLRLQPKPYFIFIETDKPIYRPGETVRFRTVTLDHAMKVTGCKAQLQLKKGNEMVRGFVNEVHGSDNVCRGEIQITPTMVGDFEIQATSTQLYLEFNGHRKFRVEEPAGEKKDEEEVLSQVVHLTKTRRFFTPGAPFRIQALVAHPDGTVVPKAPIEVSIIISEKMSIQKSTQGFTDELGEMSIAFVVPEDAREMYVTASVNDTLGNEVKRKIAIKAHQSNGVYMHIDVPNVLLYAGDTVNITLMDLGPTNGSLVEHYYYMILSKGKLLHHERIERSTNTYVQVNVTQDMVPYFRMVAYYFTDDNGQNLLVSDSVRVEVEDSCDLQLQVLPSLFADVDQRDLLLSVLTRPSTDVYVKAVDNRLAKAHVDLGIYEQAFYRRDLYDFGASYGGGRDAAAVFEDAGLRFLSDLLPPSELSEVLDVPWHRSQLQTPRYDLEMAQPFLVVQPLYRTSWMWDIHNTSGTKTFRLTSTIDPPKVWEVSAFSVSKNEGLCIARPLLMKINEDDENV